MLHGDDGGVGPSVTALDRGQQGVRLRILLDDNIIVADGWSPSNDNDQLAPKGAVDAGGQKANPCSKVERNSKNCDSALV